MSQLLQIVKSLENSNLVDAVLLVGSQSNNKNNEYSDIDLAVIFKEKMFDLQSIFQIVDNKPCDIFFFDSVTLKLLSDANTISANKMDAVLLGWLNSAKIYFDKSGIVRFLVNNLKNIEPKIKVPEEEGVLFESKINAGYITNRRYFYSNDLQYHEALEIKLLQDLYNIFIGYFEFRSIPWRGEKNMLNYIKENDKTFYDLYVSSLHTSNLKDKFEIYTQLVKSVFHGEYSLWNDEIFRPYTNKSLKKEESVHLINFWKELISIK